MTENNRKRLTIKLRALIAVLKVAIQKLEVMKKEPDARVDNIDDSINNLEMTLSICHRAMKTLDRMPNLGRSPSPSGAREYTEMTDIKEYRKFQGMEPITLDEVAGVDMDDLIKRLQ
tara:strand:+ start:1500 stop:1850 length:351 start_codon:yes stop_codon:yes gene_type:complete